MVKPFPATIVFPAPTELCSVERVIVDSIPFWCVHSAGTRPLAFSPAPWF